MPRGETTIEFDFPIRYSRSGNFEEARSVTVRAPGLGKMHVHSTMAAYASAAIREMLKASEDQIRSSFADDDDEDGQPPSAADDVAPDYMTMMSVYLGVKTFPEFVAYCKGVLSDAPKLATVGDTDVPLTAEVWDSLDAEGGVEAVFKILGAFTGFFFPKPAPAKSKKANGKSSSRSSSGRSKAA